MSKKAGVFICPSCQGVVQSDGPLEQGVVCDHCLHEFGTPDDLSAAKAALVNKLPKGSVGGVEKKKVLISRNVTAQRKVDEPKQVEAVRAKIPVKTLEESVEEAANGSRDEETIMPDGSRKVKRRKKRPKKEKNLKLVLFLAGWISVIGIVFALFKLGDSEGEVVEETETEEEINEKTIKNEVLRRFFPQVSESFTDFLTHPTNDGREQFISNSSGLALPFSKYYLYNPFPKPESSMRVSASNVIRLSEKDFAIETIWKNKDGNRLGAAHLWDGEAWKLDWENFAPYSTESWSRFRAELGGTEGEFRLLARKRETSDESEHFYVSFYRPPLFFENSEEFRSTESPEVELETDSELGQRFLNLWKDHKAGKVPLDSILGKSLDPSNYLRMNVQLAWEKNDQDESILVLKDIIGVLWFGDVIQTHYRNSLKMSATDAGEILGDE